MLYSIYAYFVVYRVYFVVYRTCSSVAYFIVCTVWDSNSRAYASTDDWFVVYSYHYASCPYVNTKTRVTMMAIYTGLGSESVVLRANYDRGNTYKQLVLSPT